MGKVGERSKFSVRSTRCRATYTFRFRSGATRCVLSVARNRSTKTGVSPCSAWSRQEKVNEWDQQQYELYNHDTKAALEGLERRREGPCRVVAPTHGQGQEKQRHFVVSTAYLWCGISCSALEYLAPHCGEQSDFLSSGVFPAEEQKWGVQSSVVGIAHRDLH